MLDGGARAQRVPGPGGPPNTLAIGTVATGSAGSQAAASIVGASPTQTLNLTIPRGDQGAAGPTPWQPPKAWVAGIVCVASAPATAVVYGGETYVCIGSHIAVAFANDLSAGLWIRVAQKGVDGTNGTNGTNGVQPWQTPPVAWAASTAYTATAPASCVTYGGGCYVCSIAHASGATFDASKWTLIASAAGALLAANNLSDLASAGSARTNLGLAILPIGQCRLFYSSASTLLLKGVRGNQIWVNGAFRTIPAAGVSLANTGLAAATLYYVYAFMSGSALALEASTTGHAADATFGHEIKSGDGTRTLVGMVYTAAGTPGTFADSSSQRYVASWFNQRDGVLVNNPTTLTSSGTYGAITNPVYGLTWGLEPLSADISGNVQNTGVGTCFTINNIDGNNAGSESVAVIQTANYQQAVSARQDVTLSEGLHTFNIYGRVTGGTGAYTVTQFVRMRI